MLLLLLLGLPVPAAGQTRRRRRRPAEAPPPGRPQIDPAPRAGLAPVPDRRFPTLEQATPPGTRVLPVVPTGTSPTRGSSFSERDINPEALGRRESPRPQPGVSVRTPLP